MSQSLSKVYLHIIFSTKDRVPFLSQPRAREEVHRYLGGVCGNQNCPPSIVGGVADHVHVLCVLGRIVTQANLIKELKRASSIWIKQRFIELEKFSWQNGYGTFSIGQSQVAEVRRYIETQSEHHRQLSFQDEFRAFLKKYEVVYDEKYVWE